MEEMEHIYSGIRSMKHDMKNTLSVIMQLATGNEETENAELQAYLSELNRTMERLEFQFRTGNTVVDTLLNMKYHEAVRTIPDMQMDADRLHDPCNVLRIYQSLISKDENGEYPDIVLGSRFLENSGEYPVGAVRKFAMNLFSGIIKLLTGKVVKDPTTGLQGLSWRTVLFYSKYGYFDDRYPDANMILQMQLLGFRIVEIPAVMHVRTEGISMHSGLKPIIYMFRMVFSLMAVWVRIKIMKIDVGAIDEDI